MMSEPFYVLVLCQRKSSTNEEEYVKHSITKLKKYVYNLPLFNIQSSIKSDQSNQNRSNIIFEYLTDGIGFEHDEWGADYKFSLKKGSNIDKEKYDRFIENNKSKYSLIILNTCPILFMDFTIIYKLLNSNGKIVFTRFGGDEDDDGEWEPYAKNMRNKDIFKSNGAGFFKPMDETDDKWYTEDVYGIWYKKHKWYQGKAVQNKQIKNKKKNTNKKIKNKKIQKYKNTKKIKLILK